MTDKYQRIRDALAMGPTPGPFFVANGSDVFTALGATNAQGTRADEDDGWHVADCFGDTTYVNGESMSLTHSESKANAHLIAACDPDTIRGLLAERDALQAECERLRSLIRDIKEWDCQVDGGFFSIPMPLRRRIQKAIDAAMAGGEA